MKQKNLHIMFKKKAIWPGRLLSNNQSMHLQAHVE